MPKEKQYFLNITVIRHAYCIPVTVCDDLCESKLIKPSMDGEGLAYVFMYS